MMRRFVLMTISFSYAYARRPPKGVGESPAGPTISYFGTPYRAVVLAVSIREQSYYSRQIDSRRAVFVSMLTVRHGGGTRQRMEVDLSKGASSYLFWIYFMRCI